MNLANVVGASVEFDGHTTSTTFQFDNSGGESFQITSSSGGTGSTVGLDGTISGTFSYSSISSTTFGGVTIQTAPVTLAVGSAAPVLTISDGAGHNLTATISMMNIVTSGSSGGVNYTDNVNLSNVAYTGSNADLLTFMNEANGPPASGTATISFQFIPPLSLTQLLTGVNKTSYSGTLVAGTDNGGSVPEPSSLSLVLCGAASLLTMTGYGLRRRRARNS
jgi:hypothetical protein